MKKIKFYQKQKKFAVDQIYENKAAFGFLKNELAGLISASEIFSNNDSIADQHVSYDSVDFDRFSVDTKKDHRCFLVDANVNNQEMLAITSPEHIYTATGINTEAASKWDKILDSDHIFQSASVADIKNNSGIVTLTASFGHNDELQSVVHYDSLDCETRCERCDGLVRGILTSNSGLVAYVCKKLSGSDQKLLVLAMAFPKKLALITEDSCLGWSSMPLNSYSLRNKKYWKNYFKILCFKQV